VTPGDLIVFDAGNYHQVMGSAGTLHRLFSHSAVLLDPATSECTLIA
jgi:hypothetical protein